METAFDLRHSGQAQSPANESQSGDQRFQREKSLIESSFDFLHCEEHLKHSNRQGVPSVSQADMHGRPGAILCFTSLPQ